MVRPAAAPAARRGRVLGVAVSAVRNGSRATAAATVRDDRSGPVSDLTGPLRTTRHRWLPPDRPRWSDPATFRCIAASSARHRGFGVGCHTLRDWLQRHLPAPPVRSGHVGSRTRPARRSRGRSPRRSEPHAARPRTTGRSRIRRQPRTPRQGRRRRAPYRVGAARSTYPMPRPASATGTKSIVSRAIGAKKKPMPRPASTKAGTRSA